jgi:hypothetical protein
MNYFNTTNLTGNNLFTAQEQAQKQDNSILVWCKKLQVFSATKIWKQKNGITEATTYGQLRKMDRLTSVRRALNTLENQGLIRKLETQVKGDYGKVENLYELC